MDMNYLYHRQQIEMMRAADAAPSSQARKIHQELADEYGEMIAKRRDLFAHVPARRG